MHTCTHRVWDLVMSCMQLNPAMRPSAQQVEARLAAIFMMAEVW
jgi:hypothetical protein